MFNLEKLNAIAKPDTEWQPAAIQRSQNRKALRREAKLKLKQLRGQRV